MNRVFVRIPLERIVGTGNENLGAIFALDRPGIGIPNDGFLTTIVGVMEPEFAAPGAEVIPPCGTGILMSSAHQIKTRQ